MMVPPARKIIAADRIMMRYNSKAVQLSGGQPLPV